MKTFLKVPRFRCRTVPLKAARHHPDFVDDWLDLGRAPAFSVNPRGQLVHRTRFVSAHLETSRHGPFKIITHYHITHLCGNGFNIHPDLLLDVLTDDPPADRMLCSYCHGRSEGMRLPSSDALAKRHVHRGILVPVQVCCQRGKKQ